MRLLKRSLLLLGLIALAATPAAAQGALRIINQGDVTGFIRDGKGVTGTTITISNETGRAGDTGMSGRLTVRVLTETFSPADAGANPLCVRVNDSACEREISIDGIVLPSEALSEVKVSVETVDGTPLQYAQATLITVFEEDSSRTDAPLLISDYRKVTFVPALYVPEVLRDTLILTAFFLLIAFSWYLIKNDNSIFKNGVWNGFKRPLGELTWGAQSWTALIGSLASTVGVFSISGGSAGINLGTFNASVYTTTITTLGILFALLPLAALIIYRLCGRPSKSAPKGGNLIGYLIGSALVVFALVGSVLISGNVIRMLIFSSFGVSDPAALAASLSGLEFARLVILSVILLYFVTNFRADITSQLNAFAAAEIKARQEEALLGKLETAWDVDHEAAAAALLALQTLPDYDLPIEKTTYRSMTKSAAALTPSSSRFASAAPKMSL
jgi:hypothetical protein